MVSRQTRKRGGSRTNQTRKVQRGAGWFSNWFKGKVDELDQILKQYEKEIREYEGKLASLAEKIDKTHAKIEKKVNIFERIEEKVKAYESGERRLSAGRLREFSNLKEEIDALAMLKMNLEKVYNESETTLKELEHKKGDFIKSLTTGKQVVTEHVKNASTEKSRHAVEVFVEKQEKAIKQQKEVIQEREQEIEYALRAEPVIIHRNTPQSSANLFEEYDSDEVPKEKKPGLFSSLKAALAKSKEKGLAERAAAREEENAARAKEEEKKALKAITDKQQNLGKNQKELDKLKDRLKEGNLSEEEKEKLEKEIDNKERDIERDEAAVLLGKQRGTPIGEKHQSNQASVSAYTEAKKGLSYLRTQGENNSYVNAAVLSQFKQEKHPEAQKALARKLVGSTPEKQKAWREWALKKGAALQARIAQIEKQATYSSTSNDEKTALKIYIQDISDDLKILDELLKLQDVIAKDVEMEEKSLVEQKRNLTPKMNTFQNKTGTERFVKETNTENDRRKKTEEARQKLLEYSESRKAEREAAKALAKNAANKTKNNAKTRRNKNAYNAQVKKNWANMAEKRKKDEEEKRKANNAAAAEKKIKADERKAAAAAASSVGLHVSRGFRNTTSTSGKTLLPAATKSTSGLAQGKTNLRGGPVNASKLTGLRAAATSGNANAARALKEAEEKEAAYQQEQAKIQRNVNDAKADAGKLVNAENARVERYCNNFIKGHVKDSVISKKEYDDLVENAKDLDMTKDEIDLCLKKNNVITLTHIGEKKEHANAAAVAATSGNVKAENDVKNIKDMINSKVKTIDANLEHVHKMIKQVNRNSLASLATNKKNGNTNITKKTGKLEILRSIQVIKENAHNAENKKIYAYNDVMKILNTIGININNISIKDNLQKLEEVKNTVEKAKTDIDKLSKDLISYNSPKKVEEKNVEEEEEEEEEEDGAAAAARLDQLKTKGKEQIILKGQQIVNTIKDTNKKFYSSDEERISILKDVQEAFRGVIIPIVEKLDAAQDVPAAEAALKEAEAAIRHSEQGVQALLNSSSEISSPKQSSDSPASLAGSLEERFRAVQVQTSNAANNKAAAKAAAKIQAFMLGAKTRRNRNRATAAAAAKAAAPSQQNSSRNASVPLAHTQPQYTGIEGLKGLIAATNPSLKGRPPPSVKWGINDSSVPPPGEAQQKEEKEKEEEKEEEDNIDQRKTKKQAEFTTQFDKITGDRSIQSKINLSKRFAEEAHDKAMKEEEKVSEAKGLQRTGNIANGLNKQYREAKAAVDFVSILSKKGGIADENKEIEAEMKDLHTYLEKISELSWNNDVGNIKNINTLKKIILTINTYVKRITEIIPRDINKKDANVDDLLQNIKDATNATIGLSYSAELYSRAISEKIKSFEQTVTNIIAIATNAGITKQDIEAVAVKANAETKARAAAAAQVATTPATKPATTPAPPTPPAAEKAATNGIFSRLFGRRKGGSRRKTRKSRKQSKARTRKNCRR